jgi:hypothetical protein
LDRRNRSRGLLSAISGEKKCLLVSTVLAGIESFFAKPQFTKLFNKLNYKKIKAIDGASAE